MFISYFHLVVFVSNGQEPQLKWLMYGFILKGLAQSNKGP